MIKKELLSSLRLLFLITLSIAISACTIPASKQDSQSADGKFRGSKGNCFVQVEKNQYRNICSEPVSIIGCDAVGWIGPPWPKCRKTEDGDGVIVKASNLLNLLPSTDYVVSCGVGQIAWVNFKANSAFPSAFCKDGGQLLVQEDDDNSPSELLAGVVAGLSIAAASKQRQTINTTPVYRPTQITQQSPPLITSYSSQSNSTAANIHPSQSNVALAGQSINTASASENCQQTGQGFDAKRAAGACQCRKINGAKFFQSSNKFHCEKGVFLFGCSQENGKLVCTQN